MAKGKPAEEPRDVVAFRRIVRENLGGPHAYATLLGFGALETAELLARVEAGFPFQTFIRFQQNLELSIEALLEIVQIKPRTLARRRKEGHLTSEESDRLLRATRVFGKALALFDGDMQAARTWFATPAPALAERTPQAASSTEIGAREVENLIGRLEHGVFS